MRNSDFSFDHFLVSAIGKNKSVDALLLNFETIKARYLSEFEKKMTSDAELMPPPPPPKPVLTDQTNAN
jgi:hypothetical protein